MFLAQTAEMMILLWNVRYFFLILILMA